MTADPLAEGRFEFGCHQWETDAMAATCETNRDLHDRLRQAFAKVDAEMTAYCMQTVRTSRDALAKALELLRVHTLELAEATRARCASCGDEMPVVLTEEIRNDWTCWCYRQFRTWSREEKNTNRNEK